MAKANILLTTNFSADPTKHKYLIKSKIWFLPKLHTKYDLWWLPFMRVKEGLQAQYNIAILRDAIQLGGENR